jgi:hypothetical protein
MMRKFLGIKADQVSSREFMCFEHQPAVLRKT